MNHRARIIEIASAEIGTQAKGSERVFDYWRAVLPPEWSDAQVKLYAKTKHWCGGFALWCLHQVGLTKQPWVDGVGFVGRAGLKHTLTPSRGDVIYIKHPFQHYALFDYEHDGWVHSVDGNQPGVEQKRRRRDGMAFYSVQPLIDKALEAAIRPVDGVDLPEGGFVRGQTHSVPGVQDPKEEP